MSFFSRFFGAGRYTRAASRDFRPEDLPDTRVKLFFDALGIRWSAMVGQNLFYLLFWLPAILWSGVNLLTLVQMLADAPAGADVGAQRVFAGVHLSARPLAADRHHRAGDGGGELRFPQLGAGAAQLHGQRFLGSTRAKTGSRRWPFPPSPGRFQCFCCSSGAFTGRWRRA